MKKVLATMARKPFLLLGVVILIIVLFFAFNNGVLNFNTSDEITFEQKLECKKLGQQLLELRKDEYMSVRDVEFIYHKKLDTCLYIADEIAYKNEKGYSDRVVIIDVLTNEFVYSDILFAGEDVDIRTEKWDRFENLKRLYLSGGEIPSIELDIDL